MKTHMVKIEDEYEKVQYCPFCGEKSLTMPNDLIEWICTSCGYWFEVR